MLRVAILGFTLFAMANPVFAGTFTVRVTNESGKPVPNAVVTIKPNGEKSPPMRSTGTYRVEQKNMQFSPFLSVVPVGSSVAFPNLDSVKHHVYSFSAAKKFELKLFARDQSRSVLLDKAGIVAVGCNIHDQMSAYIFVTDTVWTVRTDASGYVTFRDAPKKTSTVAVWHPLLRAPGGSVSKQVALSAANQTENFSVKMRAAAVRNNGGY